MAAWVADCSQDRCIQKEKGLQAGESLSEPIKLIVLPEVRPCIITLTKYSEDFKDGLTILY